MPLGKPPHGVAGLEADQLERALGCGQCDRPQQSGGNCPAQQAAQSS
jgi:hypothetical protein